VQGLVAREFHTARCHLWHYGGEINEEEQCQFVRTHQALRA
jgi:hypothetical protein